MKASQGKREIEAAFPLITELLAFSSEVSPDARVVARREMAQENARASAQIDETKRRHMDAATDISDDGLMTSAA